MLKLVKDVRLIGLGSCLDQGTWTSFEPEAGSRSRHQDIDKFKQPLTKASVRSDFVKYMLSKYSTPCNSKDMIMHVPHVA